MLNYMTPVKINKKKICFVLFFFFFFGGLLLPSLTKASFEISDGSVKGLWHLNGDSVDSSGNGNNGVDTSISYVSGKIGQGASFSGNSHIAIGTNNFVSGSNSATACAWVKFNNLGISDQGWFGYGTANLNQARMYPTGGGANSQFLSFGRYGGNASIVSNTQLMTGIWYFICERVGGTEVSYFLNGQNDNNATISGMDTVLGGYGLIGDSYPSSGSALNGYEDEVSYFGTILATSTILDLYNNGAGQEICVTAGCAGGGGSGTTTPACSSFSTDLNDISNIYYIATTTIGTTTQTTVGVYQIPYYLFRFVLSIIAVCLSVIFLYYFVRKKLK